MPWNQVVSIIANLVGVLAPLVVILTRFGTHTSVNAPDTDPLTKILYIGLSVLFAYVCCLIGSLFMRKAGAPTLMDLSRLVIDIRSGKRS